MAEYLVLPYLLIGAMAMGSWGVYLAVVAAAQVFNRTFAVFRIAVTVFGAVTWAVFALASYSVAAADGAGGTVSQSYPALAFLGFGAAVAMGLFLLDSVMKAMADEAPETDIDLSEQV